MTPALPRLKWHRLRRRAEDPAFARANIVPALASGSPCEIDLRLTKDRAFVCLHDAALDYETTGSGLVADTTRSELERLRQRGNNGAPLADPPLLLDELVAAVAVHATGIAPASVQLDVKEVDASLTPADARALARLLGSHAGCFIAGGEEWAKLVRLQQACPDLALGFDPLDLYPGTPPADAAALDLILIQAIQTAPLARMFYLEASLVLNAAVVGIDPIARLAEVGAEVDAWTIDPGRPGLDQTLRTLIRLGCQQITTNDPDRLATRLTQLLADEPHP